MRLYVYSTCISFFSYIAFLLIGAAGVKICGRCVAVVGVGRSFSGCVSVACTDSAKWLLTVDDDQFWALTTKISNAAVVSKKGEFALLLAPSLIYFFHIFVIFFCAHSCMDSGCKNHMASPMTSTA